MSDTAALALVPRAAGPRSAGEAARGFLLGFTGQPNTLRSYIRVLGEWWQACESAGTDPLDAPRDLVESYKAWLHARGRAPSTIAQRLYALRSFYSYCADEDLLPGRNPTRGVRIPRVPDESTSTGLDRTELAAFLEGAAARGPMMHALMTLYALNGVRASEPLAATVDDLGSQRGHRTLAISRKGVQGSVRVPLAPVTAERVDIWLRARAADLGQTGRGWGLLFYTRRRVTREIRALDRKDIWHYCRRIAARAVPAKAGTLHPHDLRHSFVTLSLDAGVPLRDVQDSAGHASPHTTRRYDRDRGRMDRHATYSLSAYLAGGG